MHALTDQQKHDALKRHSKFNSPCHMKCMRMHMMHGKSFDEAHRIASIKKPKTLCKCKKEKKKQKNVSRPSTSAAVPRNY